MVTVLTGVVYDEVVWIGAFSAVGGSAEACDAGSITFSCYVDIIIVVAVDGNALVVLQFPVSPTLAALAAGVAVTGQAESRTGIASFGA